MIKNSVAEGKMFSKAFSIVLKGRIRYLRHLGLWIGSFEGYFVSYILEGPKFVALSGNNLYEELYKTM